MKIIVGLGNPEPEYTHTRHNIGKDFLNFWKQDWKENKYINAQVAVVEDAVLVKPLVYMNDSGIVVKKAINFYESDTSDLLIIYDELDLEAGEFKLTYGKGSRIHNGVLSTKEKLETEDFWHLRLGVRNESIPMSVQKAGYDPVKYVLSKFDTADSGKILESFKNFVMPAALSWLSKKEPLTTINSK